MPHYAYRGRDGRGMPVSGVLEGTDSAVVAGRLFELGVTPVEIEPTAAPRAAAAGRIARRRVTREEVLLFSRQMYTLLRAGVPIMGALKGLEESAENPAFREVVRDVRESLESGRELSAALGRHPAVFNPFYIAMVRVGELTGTLEEIFIRLFDHLEFEKLMREQVRAALRYPTFVLATMAVAIVVVNLFVIPAFAKVYAGFRAELPALTQGLIAFSNFMVAYWPLLLGALALLVAGLRLYVRTPAGRLAWDRLKLRLPVAGPIVLRATLARFARSLSLAVRSGVPVSQALTTVARTVDNEFVARRIEAMREGVERGESVLRTARAAGVFTPVTLQMIAVGEETGALDDLMGEVADMYQREVEYDLRNLTAQIEPILILALGVLVLILALGVFLPIWDLGQAALRKK